MRMKKKLKLKQSVKDWLMLKVLEITVVILIVVFLNQL